MSTNQPAPSPEILSSVKNAIAVLKSFSTDTPVLKVTEISQLTGLSKSTVSRILQTLSQEDLIKKEPKYNGYRLGLGLLNLAGIALNSLEIHNEVAPLINKLVSITGETAHIAILEGFETIYLHKESSAHPTEMKTYLGKRNPAHCTSSGKVLLAYADPVTIKAFLKHGLSEHTANTITNSLKLEQELKKIKEQGYAQSFGEITFNVNSIAAPVRDYTGDVVAAITIVGSNKRLTPTKMREYTRLVIDFAKEASENLGYDERYALRS